MATIYYLVLKAKSTYQTKQSKIETLGQCIQKTDDAIALLEKHLNDLENKVEAQSKTKLKTEKTKKQAGAELCQTQVELG